ncbi:AMP-binding protein [Actinomadura soli]|uniref:AMP-binding protein n=1 Tax=Actinomadura soli TaxID=2508997 RepID=UPI0014871CFA|nr:AMP-binding protein [Actinomadura soli]
MIIPPAPPDRATAILPLGGRALDGAGAMIVAAFLAVARKYTGTNGFDVDVLDTTRRDYPRDASIHELFASHAAARPARIAIVHGDVSLTYGDLAERAGRLAATLRERGVRRHDRVALSIARVLEACPGLRVLNGYGPPENTTFSTTHHVSAPPSGRIPIGAPIANSTAHVVDLDGLPQPIGVPGELLVGGDGLADGYFGRPELDAAVFTTARFGAGDRHYRTGDLARRHPDGTIDLLGRLDDQVGARGLRAEPGEAERRPASITTTGRERS